MDKNFINIKRRGQYAEYCLLLYVLENRFTKHMFECYNKKERGGNFLLELYHMKLDYQMYLYNYDSKVPMLEGNKCTRPFLGIVFSTQDKNFFAPLTSPKKKHFYMQDTQDFLKIKGGKLGGINFNNMMPIPMEDIEKIQIEQISNKKYAHMLQMQLEWARQHQKVIQKRAYALYYLIIEKQASKKLENRCCNFSILEQSYMTYISKHSYLREAQALYYYYAI